MKSNWNKQIENKKSLIFQQRAFENVSYIAEYFKQKDWEDGVSKTNDVQ